MAYFIIRTNEMKTSFFQQNDENPTLGGDCGRNVLFSSPTNQNQSMLNLLGDHQCKLDNKGRLLFPAKLRKQMEEVVHRGLVVNRNVHEPCLTIYTMPEWEKIQQDVARLNRHSQVHASYIRKFLNGAELIELDTVGRLTIPAAMLEYAQVDLKQNNEVVLLGLFEKIELWSKENHRKMVSGEGIDYNAIADEVQKFLQQ